MHLFKMHLRDILIITTTHHSCIAWPLKELASRYFNNNALGRSMEACMIICRKAYVYQVL